MMQIVIDISEEEYEECKMQVEMIKQEGFLIESLNTALKIHVANGTPLPKGHGILIDASEKVTIQTYDDEYEVISEKTMTIEDFLTVYGDGGYTTIIDAESESEE